MSAPPCPTPDRPPPQYGHGQELLHNLPYAGMLVLGAAVLRTGLDGWAWAWPAAGGYVLYGLLGAVWIMLFVCPFCVFHGTRSCPCGYGQIAVRLRARRPENRFAEKFRRHIPVIVPLWLVPPLVGGAGLLGDFSWSGAALLAAFCVDAFVVLPLLSTRCGCAECPQRTDCPWMGQKQAG